ncbi:MAG: hypothetical protein ACXVH5_10945, partial [Ilumatobacteraceae bacterium]
PTPQLGPERSATTSAVIVRDPGVPAAEEVVELPSATGRSESANSPVDDDAQLAHAVKMGVLVGIPSVFVIAAGIGVLAGTGLGVAAMIGAWSGLFGGTYMGGLFFIHPSKRRLAKAAARASIRE